MSASALSIRARLAAAVERSVTSIFGKATGQPVTLRRSVGAPCEPLEKRLYLSLYLSGTSAYIPSSSPQETVYLNAPGIAASSISQVQITWGDPPNNDVRTVNTSGSTTYPLPVTNLNSASVPAGDDLITGQAMVNGVWQSAGSLAFDSTLGGTTNTGKALPAPSGTGTGYGVAIQPDGKIVAVGVTTTNAFAITRYNPDGTLDSSFNGSGTTTTPFGGATSKALAVSLQGDGRIVAAGVSGGKFALARYNPNGSPDTTLAGTGTLVLNGSNSPLNVSGQANAVAIQPDGRIVLAGASGGAFAAVRLNINGSPDTGFGTNGLKTVTFPNSNNSSANALLLQQVSSSLDIILGGTATVTNIGNTACNTLPTDVALTRLTPAGQVDTANFGASGYAMVNVGVYTRTHPINHVTGCYASTDNCYSLAADSNGNILIGGNTDFATPGAPEFLVGRYSAGGVIDATFGYSGLNVSNIGSIGRSVVVRPANDGRIVLGGGGSSNKFGLAAFTSTGSLDPSFGNSGTLSTSIDGGTDSIYGIAFQSDGRLVAAGVASGALAVARYLPFNTIHVAIEKPPVVGFTTIGGTAPPGGIMQINSDTAIRGVISDPNHDLTSWMLEAVPFTAGQSTIVLAQGNGATEQGWYNDGTNAYFDAQIAILKPTLLPPGTYSLAFATTDASGQQAQTPSALYAGQNFKITTALRLGTLTLPVTDLSIPAPGLPITISRYYDSSRATQDDGDFGPGWRMELPDVNFLTTAMPNGALDSAQSPALQTGDRMFITLPGGQTDAFSFQPQLIPGTPSSSQLYEPVFVDADGCHAVLSVSLAGLYPRSPGWYIQPYGGTSAWYDPTAPKGYNPNLSAYGNYYNLTTQDGTVYHINATSGKVLTVTDRNGNVLDFSNYGASTGATIMQSNPNVSGSALTITIKRGVTMSDNSTRNYIYEIDDPEGHAITYSYDTNVNDLNVGALLSVTDRSGKTTSYDYSPTQVDMLIDVKDPRGLKVLQAEYMGTTLVRVDDVYGQAAAVNTEPAYVDPNTGLTTQVQQTVDLAGNLSEDTYDGYGNRVRHATRFIDPVSGQPMWSVTVFNPTYDSNGYGGLTQMEKSVPFNGTDATRATASPAAWAAIDNYDRDFLDTSSDIFSVGGHLTSEIVGQSVCSPPADPGWTTTYNNIPFNAFGEAPEVVDPSGNRTYFVYDGNGNLLTTYHQAQSDTAPSNYADLSNPNDGVARRDRVDYTYDARGDVLTVKKWNTVSGTLTQQTVTTNTYLGPFKRLDTTTDNVTGVKHTYTYDNNGGNGNVAKDTYQWTDPSSVAWTVEEDKSYDNSDRVTSDTTNNAYQMSNPSVHFGTAPETYMGVTTQTFYNSIGKVDHTIDQYNRTTSYTYDAHGNLIQTAFPDGTYTRAVYDTLNRPIWSVDRYKPGTPDSGANGTHTIYDELGRVKETDRYTGVLITIGNDSLGQPQATLGPLGTKLSSSSTVYGQDGNPKTVTGTDGQTTSYMYNNEGRVGTVTINALNQTTTYSYFPNQKDMSGNIIRGRYDIVQAPDSTQTTTDYDYLGRVTKVTYPDTTTTQTVYGYNGQVLTGYPGTSEVTTNATGNEVVRIDQRSVATSFFYDLDGRLTDVWQPPVPDALNNGTPTSPHWQYLYDVNGNLGTIKDPKLHQTTFTYDPLGRQAGRKLPDNEQESQTYDHYGNAWVHTDFDTNTATDTYFTSGNDAGLLQRAQYAGTGLTTQTVNYSYDSLERKSQVVDPTGTTTYNYDETAGYQLNGAALPSGTTDTDGNLTSIVTPQGTIHYVYDAATGRLIETWTGTGTSNATATTDTLYGYDALGRLESVSIQKQNGATPTQTTSNTTRYGPTGTGISTTLPTTVYNYDNVGRTLSILYANGTETDYNYANYWNNPNPQITVTNKRGGTTLSTFLYTFDPARRKVSDSETVLNPGEGATITSTFTWTYDDLNRLASETFGDGATADAYKAAYSYDLAGNRYQKQSFLAANVNGSTPDQTITYTYNGDDQLTNESAASNNPSLAYSTTYTYDANGSQTHKTRTGANPESDTYNYDARNRLIQDTVAGTAASDVYNDDGDRVSETVSGTTTTYLVDAHNPTGYSQVLEAWQGGTNPATTYTIGAAVIAQNAGGVVSYLIPDGHGSTRQLTESGPTGDSNNGHVVARYDYDAFGGQLTLTNPAYSNTASTVILYTGQQLDSSLKNYYLRARYYDPTIGRFSSADSYIARPGDPANSNLYVYVADRPTSAVDPTGHDLGGLLTSIGIASLTAGLVGGAANIQHGLIGVVAGFAGGAAGTAVSLLTLPAFAAAVSPVFALPLSFGLGSAVGTSLEKLIQEGPAAFEDRSTWVEITASFIVGGALGAVGSQGTQFLRQEIEREVASMPPVWKVLGQVQGGTGVLPRNVAESGLTQDLSTIAKKYAPKLGDIAKEIFTEDISDKLTERTLVPVVQLLVGFVGDVFRLFNTPSGRS